MGAGKRAYEWTPESIRWYSAAAAVTDFHEKLAECMAESIAKTDRICDIGCGLGYLSEKLTGYAAAVDAFDIRQQAVDEVNRRAVGQGLDTLHAFVHDFFEGPSGGMVYDAAVMSLFDLGERDISTALRYAGGHLIVAVNSSGHHSFSATDSRRIPHDEEVLSSLRASGCSVTEKKLSVEFGQPFKDRDDAVAFMRYYSDDDEEAIARRLDTSLVPFGRMGYELYLPGRKEITVLDARAAFSL